MPITCLLFDFDGTLADSFDAIASSTNHVRQLYGLPRLPEPDIRSHVGYGLEHLLRNLVPNVSTADAVEAYRSHHAGVMISETRLFPGVRETLQTARHCGIKTAICSNKRVEFTRQLATQLNISPMIDTILGPEDVGVAKPDPAMLFEAMRRLEGTAEETVYVGDMTIDIEVARNARLPVWIVLGGASSRSQLEAAKPDRLLSNFWDVQRLISL